MGSQRKSLFDQKGLLLDEQLPAKPYTYDPPADKMAALKALHTELLQLQENADATLQEMQHVTAQMTALLKDM